jgi:hypothetical protein
MAKDDDFETRIKQLMELMDDDGGERVPKTVTVNKFLYNEAQKHFKGKIGRILDEALARAIEAKKKSMKKKGA